MWKRVLFFVAIAYAYSAEEARKDAQKAHHESVTVHTKQSIEKCYGRIKEAAASGQNSVICYCNWDNDVCGSLSEKLHSDGYKTIHRGVLDVWW